MAQIVHKERNNSILLTDRNLNTSFFDPAVRRIQLRKGRSISRFSRIIVTIRFLIRVELGTPDSFTGDDRIYNVIYFCYT